MTGGRPIFTSPGDLAAPAGYSHVVSIPSGRLVWTSGQVAMDVDRNVPAGWEAQTRLAFGNAGRALAAAGADWPDVVKLTIFAVDVNELETIRAALKKRFGRDVEIETAVDASLIGGAVIDAGDVVIDGSLKGKLARLQSALAS